MIKFLAFAVATIACAASAAASDVVVLTDANFDGYVNDNEFVLVEFYAPWCGHCKNLAPEYEKAATALKEYDDKIVIAKMDATAETEVSKKFGVQGFPTLKWFVNGEARDYGGGRTEATIISWVKKKTGPAFKAIESASDLESFKDSSDVVVVGAFESDDNAATFKKAAQAEEEIPFGLIVDNSDAATAAGITGEGVIVFKKFDEGEAAYEGELDDVDALGEFVAGNALPLIIPFTQENAPKIFGGKIKNHVLLFVDKDDASTKESVEETARAVAPEFKGKALFVTVDKSDSRILEFFGLTGDDLPAVRVVDMGDEGMKKFAYSEDEITSDGLKTFLEDFYAGKLEADLKSEEPIKDEDQENVWVLAGKNFEEIIAKPGVDVLVEFYAPWCGHCKKLAPIYDEIGELYAGDDKLIIAKMDATANEIERLSISGFPTIYYFEDGKDEITYDGGRDKQGFIDFLTEKGHPSP